MVQLFLVIKKNFFFLDFKTNLIFIILGIHIEGPFIDENKRGAHRTDFLRKSPHGIEDLLSCYGSFENVSIITIAPEIPNMIENVIPKLVEKYNLIVSIGHSVASLDQGERAVCAGARFITHLFNAMLPFHHRDPGLVGMRKKKTKF
jgi:N-acetylglucosamine-6-phosphate deacetylase